MTYLATYKPIRHLFSSYRDVGRIFTECFDKWDVACSMTDTNWAPPVDVVDTGDHVEFRAEVPGLSKEDVHVSVSHHVLTLAGEKKAESEEKNGSYHRAERRYGNFRRSFNLPRNLSINDVSAAFKNGILTILVPKSQEAQSKEIAISTG